jgi:hypothetical protein
VELDGALARNRSLEHAADEVSRRLEAARATVQNLLSVAEAGELAGRDRP